MGALDLWARPEQAREAARASLFIYVRPGSARAWRVRAICDVPGSSTGPLRHNEVAPPSGILCWTGPCLHTSPTITIDLCIALSGSEVQAEVYSPSSESDGQMHR